MNATRSILVWMLLPALLVSLAGCETMKEHPIVTGAVIGTATGALAGGVIGHQSGHRTAGALIGAAAGAAVGGGIGYYIDRQQKKLQEIKDVEVQKVESQPAPPPTAAEPQPAPQPEHLVLRMSNEILFERGSSALKPQGVSKLAEIADVLREYEKSHINVKGYTSSEGSDADNLALSKRRAEVVSNQLVANRVDPRRITALGMGESNPMADNATEAGRAQNRRVEIEVFPEEEVR